MRISSTPPQPSQNIGNRSPQRRGIVSGQGLKHYDGVCGAAGDCDDMVHGIRQRQDSIAADTSADELDAHFAAGGHRKTYGPAGIAAQRPVAKAGSRRYTGPAGSPAVGAPGVHRDVEGRVVTGQREFGGVEPA